MRYSCLPTLLRLVSSTSPTTIASPPSTTTSAFASHRTRASSILDRTGGASGVLRTPRSGTMSSSSSSSTTPSSGGGGADDGTGEATGKGGKNLVVDPFCHRQFVEMNGDEGGGYAGALFDMSISAFEDVVNSRYDPSNLVDGYAPFCKHLFVINDFTTARVNVLPITRDNEIHLRSRYESRTELELPVLTRYFDRESLLPRGGGGGGGGEDVFPVAKYLDLILYSREQIEKENIAMGKKNGDGETRETAPWGIVSIKAQDVDFELPMTPITMMRNALGKDQGGSGVMLSREAYMESVAYWRDHANVL